MDGNQSQTFEEVLRHLPTETIIREVIRRMTDGKDDPDRAGLADTPNRVVVAWQEIFSGYRWDEHRVRKLLVRSQFPEPGADQMVVVRPIRFFATCEHHLLSFDGTAAVGYVPNGQTVLGLSKLARLVPIFSRRLTTQERICREVTDALMDAVSGIKGAGCVVKAKHLCMGCRGAAQPDAETVTSSLKGALYDKPEARAEFLQLAGY